MTTPRLRSLLSASLAAAMLSGCAAATPPADPSPTPTSRYTRVTGTPTAYRSQTFDTAFGQKCRLDDERGVADLTFPGRGEAPTGGMVGAGATVAVLLPGAGQSACDLWPLALELAQPAGVRVAVVDVCPTEDCAEPVDPVGFAKALATWARNNRATRFVLVGGDTGGAMAVQAADDVRADAVVAVSAPPAGAAGANLASDARTLTMPTLWIYDPSLDVDDFKVASAAFATVPSATKRLFQTNSGHGWELLRNDPVALATVSSYIRGAYATS